MSARLPSFRSGGLLAFAAAVTFGGTIPVIARFGSGAGAFTTAALLYFGAAISGVAHILRRPRHAAMQQRDRLQLVGVALVGAAIAPALFAWGLQHAGATAGSLLLNLEAVFTMLLARVIYRESLTRQAASALVVMTASRAFSRAKARS